MKKTIVSSHTTAHSAFLMSPELNGFICARINLPVWPLRYSPFTKHDAISYFVVDVLQLFGGDRSWQKRMNFSNSSFSLSCAQLRGQRCLDILYTLLIAARPFDGVEYLAAAKVECVLDQFVATHSAASK